MRMARLIRGRARIHTGYLSNSVAIWASPPPPLSSTTVHPGCPTQGSQRGMFWKREQHVSHKALSFLTLVTKEVLFSLLPVSALPQEAQPYLERLVLPIDNLCLSLDRLSLSSWLGAHMVKIFPVYFPQWPSCPLYSVTHLGTRQ